MVVRLLPITVVLVLLGFTLTTLAEEKKEKAVNVEATSPAKRFDKGRKWAVLIGVNEYVDPNINKLKYCVSDVRLMEKVLVEKCGYEKDRILVIADDQKSLHLRPGLTSLQKQIQGWLSKAEKGDTVLVFFSGHGFLDKQGQGYLAPSNCQLNNLAFWGYRTDELRNKLKTCQASQKILILDCCHSGAKGDNKGPSSEKVAAGFEKTEGLITLASSRKEGESQEWDEKKQGLFTYYLAEGLGGKADKDNNGIVDSDDINTYLYSKVSLTAQKKLNKKQTPVRIIGEDVVGLFGLSRVSIRPEMVLGANEVLLKFTLRNESSKERIKPVVADAVVELLYRPSKDANPVTVVQGTSDSHGNVTLKAKLTAIQQLRGDFLALVRKYDQSKLWSLKSLSKRGNWDLTLPVPSEDPDYAMGVKYNVGDGVPIDYQKSLELFRKAADRGNVLAMTFIGDQYGNGDRIKKDEEEAVRWYKKINARLIQTCCKWSSHGTITVRLYVPKRVGCQAG